MLFSILIYLKNVIYSHDDNAEFITAINKNNKLLLFSYRNKLHLRSNIENSFRL